MGALRTKKVKVYQYVTNVCEGVVSYEGENYLMMIDDNGVTQVFPWASISRIEVLIEKGKLGRLSATL